MKQIELYNKARELFEARFTGLPPAPTLIIHLLITRADPATGIVENLSYRDLALLMSVDHAPGRKNAGTPKIETIRSYLRTITKSCPDDFKLMSEGQKLKIKFVNMPKIYAHFCASKEVYREERAEENPLESLTALEEMSEIDRFLGTDENTEPSRESEKKASVKNINILNINNNNNNQSKTLPQFPIADNFTPSPEILARAIAFGYTDAADFSVIQDFIDKNKAWGSQFADFNPIYLSFLAKRAERQQKQQHHAENHSGRSTYASHAYQTAKPNPSARVKNAYASKFDFDEATGRFHEKARNAHRKHCHTVVAAN